MSQNLLLRAAAFAGTVHAGQKRKYTGEHYIYHPVAVCELLKEYSETFTAEMGAAALLHDTLEDTDTTFDDLMDNFGAQVAKWVLQVSDVSKPTDGNRAVRKQIDLLHLARADRVAKTIKLADLIDNTKSIVEYDPNFAKVYLNEKAELLKVLGEGDRRLWMMAHAGLTEAQRV